MKIFIHGLESSNQGAKAIYFRERFPEMLIPYFSGDLRERMDALHELLMAKTGITLIGSSFGGLMASLFAMGDEERVDRLILLAPALNHMESSGFPLREISVPVLIYHGEQDEVIPIHAVEKAAQKYFRNFTFNRVQDDHFLHKTFQAIDWKTLLNKEEQDV
jgi:pimeloyl-ACP methyl ester carboxylesterase